MFDEKIQPELYSHINCAEIKAQMFMNGGGKKCLFSRPSNPKVRSPREGSHRRSGQAVARDGDRWRGRWRFRCGETSSTRRFSLSSALLAVVSTTAHARGRRGSHQLKHLLPTFQKFQTKIQFEQKFNPSNCGSVDRTKALFNPCRNIF